MIFFNLFTFILSTFISDAFKNTFHLHNKFRMSNKLYNQNILNNDNFVYIISHHYLCDDYFYPSYCDLHRIYKTDT